MDNYLHVCEMSMSMETLTFGGTNYISTPSKGRHGYKNCSFYGQKFEEVASKRKILYQGCCPTGLPGGLLSRPHPLITLGGVCPFESTTNGGQLDVLGHNFL